jgi:hypothetical protein
MHGIDTIIIIAIFAMAIPVAVSRWIFRVNDIVAKLDKIIDLLSKK